MGQDVIQTIEGLKTDASNKPFKEVKIIKSGELVLLSKGKGEL